MIGCELLPGKEQKFTVAVCHLLWCRDATCNGFVFEQNIRVFRTYADLLHNLIGQQEGNMALDVYLQIEGIKGESQDDKHKDWIEVAGIHWGVHQPRSATASTGGGHTAERVEMSDISFSKLSDISSPILLQTCASGKTIPRAKFEFFRADGNGDRIKYFEIELENILIGMVKPHLGGSELILSENVNLKFSKVKWKYTQQKIGGSIGGNTAGGWDLATNRIA
jgi:type VI secretion system secreted protein Hcp